MNQEPTQAEAKRVEQPKVLHLTLKKKWFDMILSGEKKEEYRDISKYWLRRLKWNAKTSITQGRFRDFEMVRFARGGHFHSSIPQITVKCLGITADFGGREEWGAEPGKMYFIITLGKILSIDNLKIPEGNSKTLTPTP